MKLKRLGPSMTEVERADGTRILYSYETPCAAYIPRGFGELAGGWIKTDKFFSRTTAGHVTKWLAPGARARIVPHYEIEKIADGGTGS